ncbi:MAG: SCO family protein [Legionella sp.]|nr:SCO family protein [Legionella sp.]
MFLKKTTRNYLGICLLSLVGLIAGILLSKHVHIPKKIDLTHFHGTYLETPRTVQPFKLKGIDNKLFDNSKLKGKWTFVFFGFTQCGYLCPTTMAELGKMYKILEKKELELPQVVMISIDPESDTLDKLKQYVQAFNPKFFAARGNDSIIEAMTKEMGIVYQKIASKSGDSKRRYDIQHSGAIMLFNPKGQLNVFFTLPHNANLMAKDYMLLAS